MIQFLYPALLFLAPLVLGLLIYVYRRRKNRAPQIVPTLFILKKFKTLASSRQKFFPPPRFFLELLLLTMLLFGAAGMFKKELNKPQKESFDNLALKTNEEEQIKNQKVKLKINSDLSLAELKIEKIPNLEAVEKEGEKTVLLFHRKSPEKLPEMPALFVLPPEDTKLLNSKLFNEAQELVRWQSTHPILRYLNLPLLKITRGKILSVPAWGTELITAKQGALAVAGELNGNRYVFLGFEIFPFDGKESPTTSIITLNALNWLNYFPIQESKTSAKPKKEVQTTEAISLLKIIALATLALLLIDILIFRFNRA